MTSDYTIYGVEGPIRNQKIHNIVQALASARIKGDLRRQELLKQRLERRQKTDLPSLRPYDSGN